MIWLDKDRIYYDTSNTFLMEDQSQYERGSVFMKNLKMSRLTWAVRWQASGQFKGLKYDNVACLPIMKLIDECWGIP